MRWVIGVPFEKMEPIAEYLRPRDIYIPHVRRGEESYPGLEEKLRTFDDLVEGANCMITLCLERVAQDLTGYWGKE